MALKKKKFNGNLNSSQVAAFIQLKATTEAHPRGVDGCGESKQDCKLAHWESDDARLQKREAKKKERK